MPWEGGRANKKGYSFIFSRISSVKKMKGGKEKERGKKGKGERKERGFFYGSFGRLQKRGEKKEKRKGERGKRRNLEG